MTVAYQSQCPLRCKPLHRSLLLSDLAEQTGHRVLVAPRISHAGSVRCMPFWFYSLELKSKKIFQIHIESYKNTRISYTKAHTHNDIDISLGNSWIRILSKEPIKHAEVFRSCFIFYRKMRSVVVGYNIQPADQCQQSDLQSVVRQPNASKVTNGSNATWVTLG